MVVRKHTLFIFHYSICPLDAMSHPFEDSMWWISKWNPEESTAARGKPWQLICTFINRWSRDEKMQHESGQSLFSSFIKSKAWTQRRTYRGHMSGIIKKKPSVHPCYVCTAAVPQGQEDSLPGDHGVNVGRLESRWKSHKKSREAFESSGIPLLLRGSSGRRQEPVERAR